MMKEDSKTKPDLNYPCIWIYKIIGANRDEMQSAVLEIIQDRTCSITLSRRSENARYHSLNVEVTVESDSHRKNIYEALMAHRAIKIVL